MRFPALNRSGGQLARVLAEHGPLTMEQCVAIHGHFGTYACNTIKNFESAVKQGWIEQKGAVYHLMPHIKHFIDCNPVSDKQAADLVPPRKVNLFTPPLTAKHHISALGLRAGSNDHLAWQSKHV